MSKLQFRSISSYIRSVKSNVFKCAKAFLTIDHHSMYVLFSQLTAGDVFQGICLLSLHNLCIHIGVDAPT